MSYKVNKDTNTNIRIFLIFYIYIIHNTNINKKIKFTKEVKSIKEEIPDKISMWKHICDIFYLNKNTFFVPVFVYCV